MTDAEEVPLTARMWLALRDESWTNGERLLAVGEYRKAGELAWGAVGQAIHALALSRGKAASLSHSALKGYARLVSKETKNQTIFERYKLAERLHANFFVNFMKAAEVLETMREVRRLLSDLEDLTRLPDEQET